MSAEKRYGKKPETQYVVPADPGFTRQELRGLFPDPNEAVWQLLDEIDALEEQLKIAHALPVETDDG